MIFKKDELKHLWPFYLSNFLYGFLAVIAPFVVIYFMDIGLSFFQISAFMAAIGISCFIFEIPTGVFADDYSRKASTVIGFLIIGLSGFLIPFSNEFIFILSLGFLEGLGISLISGASESWTIDNLNQLKRKDLHNEFFIKERSIMSFGLIFAPLMGALIIKYYPMSTLWFVYGIGTMLSGLALIFAEEHYKPKKISILESFKKNISGSTKGFKFILTKKNFLYFIIGSIFIILMDVGANGWAPFLVELSMPVYGLGYMVSAIAIFSVFTPFISRKLLGLGIRKVLLWNVFLSTLILFSILFINSPFYLIAVIVLILLDTITCVSKPITSSFIHKLLPTKIRATTLSSQSIIMRITMPVMVLIGGALLDIFGPQKVIAFGGIFGIFAIFFFNKIKE
ncbi:MFS transporter [Candidatus Woesearchaeota archaeon]|nr:MFS transporter [Candidatus Woesearchaeota archaeon]